MESAEPEQFEELANDTADDAEATQSENATSSVVKTEVKMEVDSERDPNENFEEKMECVVKAEPPDTAEASTTTTPTPPIPVPPTIKEEIKSEVNHESTLEGTKEEETNVNFASSNNNNSSSVSIAAAASTTTATATTSAVTITSTTMNSRNTIGTSTNNISATPTTATGLTTSASALNNLVTTNSTSTSTSTINILTASTTVTPSSTINAGTNTVSTGTSTVTAMMVNEKATSTPKSSLQFERLGEFMEKESNAINGCITPSNNNNNSYVEEIQRFNILPKEPCDFTSITSSQPGGWVESGGELRIPVLQYSGCPSPCPSPLPLPLSAEEAALLEHCKTHGLPKPGKPKPISTDLRKGWWKISEDKIKDVVANLEPRGVREREFLASITRMRTDHTWESTLKSCTSGDPSRSELKIVGEISNEQPGPDSPDSWNQEAALRVDLAALSQVEALEEKVASASMQLKGWKVPPRMSTSGIPFQPACIASQSDLNPVAIAKERLLQLFEAIERRYLKPPLGTNTGDVKLAMSGGCSSSSNSQNNEDGSGTPETSKDCKGLMVWREALNKSQTAAQLAMVQQALEASIAWDKSIMKAVSPLQNAQTNCQFCHSGDNEDKLLLCDGCDKGYHTYCFKPKMENIPDGDWYCHQCLNKAKGEKNCIVCGKKVGRNLLVCEACPTAYHTDCMNPPLNKVPRGKWYCSGCASKHPKKKATRRSQPNNTSPSPLKSADEMTNSTESLHLGGEEESGVTAAAPVVKKEKTGKRLNKELAPCRIVLDELESHDEAWPFLLAVNTKQFPTYKKVIRNPMDLQTIGRRLASNEYKSREEFASDVRLIFDNCEKFNEDYSPVGKAGHTLRLFFETRWSELTNTKGQG